MSWLWLQEKEASRELQYHKVKGSGGLSWPPSKLLVVLLVWRISITADLFTKALDHDSNLKTH